MYPVYFQFARSIVIIVLSWAGSQSAIQTVASPVTPTKPMELAMVCARVFKNMMKISDKIMS